jgi:hypothetical protein
MKRKRISYNLHIIPTPLPVRENLNSILSQIELIVIHCYIYQQHVSLDY